MSSFQKSLYVLYALILIISASYFVEDFQTTHNYLEAWIAQWYSLRQWVLFIPATVLGVLIAQEEVNN